MYETSANALTTELLREVTDLGVRDISECCVVVQPLFLADDALQDESAGVVPLDQLRQLVLQLRGQVACPVVSKHGQLKEEILYNTMLARIIWDNTTSTRHCLYFNSYLLSISAVRCG